MGAEGSAYVSPKSCSLLGEDEIELDENGQSVTSRREMVEKYNKFDSFLLRNRYRIEGTPKLSPVQ